MKQPSRFARPRNSGWRHLRKLWDYIIGLPSSAWGKGSGAGGHFDPVSLIILAYTWLIINEVNAVWLYPTATSCLLC